jgi:hypothetical protein
LLYQVSIGTGMPQVACCTSSLAERTALFL